MQGCDKSWVAGQPYNLGGGYDSVAVCHITASPHKASHPLDMFCNNALESCKEGQKRSFVSKKQKNKIKV